MGTVPEAAAAFRQEKACAEHDADLRTHLPVFRVPDVAGGDPRFTDLLRRMGLES